VDVRRLVTVAGVEEATIRAEAKNGGHGGKLAADRSLAELRSMLPHNAKSQVASESNKSERSEHSLNRLTTSAIVGRPARGPLLAPAEN
jgi:hypothetical protein